MDSRIAELIDEATAARRRGHTKQAMEQYQQAAHLARQSQHAAELAHLLRHISELAKDLGDFPEALSAGLAAADLYRRMANDRLGLANALRVTALAHDASNQPELADPCWAEARGLYSELGIAAGVTECDARLSNRPVL